MKTFRMFGMAMLAVLMGVGFTSCSKDDSDGGDVSNEKKLTKIVGTTEGSSITYDFKYDNNNRLSEINIDGKPVYTYIWGDDAIKTNSTTYTLENGLVRKYNKTITYNQSNRPIKIVPDQGNYEVTLIWDGDKLASVSEVNSDKQYGYTDNITISYEKTCKKGYSPLFVTNVGMDDLLFMAHPELIGTRTKQLPANVSNSRIHNHTSGVNSSYSYTYDYEFDNSGYISKIHENGYYVNHSGNEERHYSSLSYTLTWE